MSGSSSDMIERVYAANADMLYRVALTYLHNRDDAEDAVHDAFMTYLEKAPHFYSVKKERAWLCRVTVNLCRDALRRRAVRQHASLDDPEGVTVPAAKDAYPVELFDLLDRLPEKLRLVTVLYYLEGFSVAEVAAMTASTVSAVKMRLSRARASLQELFGGESE